MSEAAKLLGVDRTRVQQLAREGKLVGRKLDGEWVIDEASVMARLAATGGRTERPAAPAAHVVVAHPIPSRAHAPCPRRPAAV